MALDLVPISVSLLDRLAALGVDVARLLRDVNLARSRFESSKAYVTTGEFFAFWHAVAGAGGARDVGLRIGGDTLAHQHNVASMAAQCSPTLGDGLKKLARYKRLVCPEQISVDIVRDEARLRFEWLLAEDDPPTLLIDGVFASVLALARRGTGKPVALRRLELARRRTDEPMLRRHFGCDVRFDAPHDLLVLDAKLLAEPLVTHNPELLELIVPGLEKALNDGRGRTLADDVRTALSQRICGERPRRREDREVAGDESAHVAAPPRRARDELPAAPRRRASPLGAAAPREHGPRLERGGVSVGLRRAQLVHARLPRLGRHDADTMARKRRYVEERTIR